MADYTLSAKITGDATSLKKSFEEAQRSLEGVSRNMESAGKKFMPVTAAIGGVGLASGKMALDFEDNMANVNTLLDDTTNLKGYEDAVKRLSNETGISAGTMAQGMYQAISSLGDGGGETEKIFETMSKSAKAGGADVSDSVSLISAGMKGYNSVNGETAQKISDLAFQTAKLGVTTFPEMAKSMQPLFPLSNSLNISYEELFGSMSTLTGVTGNTAEVSTQLKAVMGGLMTPTGAMSKLLDKYGYENGAAMIKSEGLAGTLKILQTETGGQSDKLAELFGSQEAIVAMTALTGSQFDTFNDKLGQMQNATGATQAAYDKLATSGDKIRVAWNRIKNTGLELGSTIIDTLAPAIDSMADKVDAFATWFTSLDDSQRKTIITIAGVVTAIGPLLIGLSKISSGASSVIGLVSKFGILFSPITLIIGAIAALAAGFVYLMNTNQAFHDRVVQIWDAVKNKITEIVSSLPGVLQGVFNGDLFSGLGAAFQNAISKLPSLLQGGLSGIIPSITQSFSGIGSILEGVMDKISTVFESGGLKVAAFIAVFAGISTKLGGPISGLSSMIVGGFGKIGTVFSTVANVIKVNGGGITGIVNGISTVFSQAGGVTGIFSSGLSGIGQALAGLVSPVGIVAGIITALAAGFIYLMATNSQFRETIMSLVQSIGSSLAPILTMVKDAITEIATTVMPVIISAVQQLLPFIGQIIIVIMQIVAAIAPMITQLLGALLPVITNIITVVMNIVTAVMPAVVAIMNVVMSIIQALVPIITNILSVVISVISGIVSTISPIVSFIGGIITAIMSVISPIIAFVANIIATIIQVVGTIIGAVTGVFSTVFSIVSGIWNNICDFVSRAINAIGTVISTLSSIVGGVFNSIYSIVSSIMGNIRSFISGVFDGIKSAWSGLTSFVSGVFSGISSAVQKLVSTVKGFVNNVIGGINAAVNLINLIPGVNISGIPYLVHGTDDWQGGFARMNEGGRGELTYLPDGTQVIPHDVSMKYAKESARTGGGTSVMPIDYDLLASKIASAAGGDIVLQNFEEGKLTSEKVYTAQSIHALRSGGRG